MSLSRNFFSRAAMMAVGAVLCAGFFAPRTAEAQTANDIFNRITQLRAELEILLQQAAMLSGAPQGGAVQFTRTLSYGATDAVTGGEVSRLQAFLKNDPAVYPEGLVTGFFGSLTERAVQRWQEKQGIVSSGTPATNGYGMVGPRTRAALNTATGSSSAGPFVGKPLITHIAPVTGRPGTAVTLTGLGFAPTENTVIFGNGVIPHLKSADTKTIAFAIPTVVYPECRYATPRCTATGTAITAGTYAISVKHASGTSGYINLTVAAASAATSTTSAQRTPFVFSLSGATNARLTKPISGYASTSFAFAVTPQSGTSTAVSFSVSGLPSGATVAAIGACTPSCTKTGIITIRSTTPAGTSTVTITGRTRERVSTTTFTLSVLPPPPLGYVLSHPAGISVKKPATGSFIATTTVTITPGTSTPSLTSFAISGLPAGVTAGAMTSCTPTCTKTISLAIRSAAAAGTSQITLTAKALGYAASTSFALVIAPPDPFLFSVGASQDISVLRPASGATAVATNTISVALGSGSAQSVALAQSGLPAGTTAALLGSCAPSCSKTNTLTVRDTTPVGTYPIAITGTAGSATATSSYLLTVSDPEPMSLRLWPSNDIAVTRPAVGSVTATNTIFADLLSGTARAIAFSQTGLPSGVSAVPLGTCIPTCEKINSFTVSSDAALGDWIMSVTAASGESTAETSFLLSIADPLPFDFWLDVYGDVFVVQPSSGIATGTNEFVLTEYTGTPQPVSLIQEGLPPGAMAPPLASCTPTCTRQNTITITSDVPAGYYPILVSGTGGDASRTGVYYLIVQEAF